MPSRNLKEAERLSDELAAAHHKAEDVINEEAAWLHKTLEPMLRPFEVLQTRTKDLPNVGRDVRELADSVERQRTLLEEVCDRVQSLETAELKTAAARHSASLSALVGDVRVLSESVGEVRAFQDRNATEMQQSLASTAGDVGRLGAQLEALVARTDALSMALQAQTALLEQMEKQLMRWEDADRRYTKDLQAGFKRQRLEHYLLTLLLLAALGLLALWFRL